MADKKIEVMETLFNAKNTPSQVDAITKAQEQASGDYDPHLHRNAPHPTSNIATLIHLLKGSLGTGILAMPEAFKNAGQTTGLISTVLIGILCTYGIHVLVNSQYILCKRLQVPMLTYAESMKVALGTGPRCLRRYAKRSPYMIDTFLVIYQLGICCVYVLFVSVNLKAVCDEFTPEDIALEFYMLMMIIPFIIVNLVRNLKLLSPFSIIGNLLTFGSFGIVIYYVVQDLPSLADVPHFGSVYTYPLFFGTTLFALEAVGIVVAVENNMKTPKSFGGWFGIFNIAMFVIVVSYIGMGYMGYWRYGALVEPSITLNFPSEEALSKTCRSLFAIAVFFSYGLNAYVPIQILWDAYIFKHLKKNFLLYEYLLRIGVVLVTFIAAISIPMLGLFISLVGAFCLSGLGIAFPAIIEICTRYPDKLGRCKWILIKDILLIIFGIVGLLAGCYCSISEIVIALEKKYTGG